MADEGAERKVEVTGEGGNSRSRRYTKKSRENFAKGLEDSLCEEQVQLEVLDWREYLEFDPELRDYLLRYREDLFSVLGRFKKRLDKPELSNVRAAVERFINDFDAMLSRLLAFIDLKNNPEFRDRLMTNLNVPYLTMTQAMRFMNPDAIASAEWDERLFADVISISEDSSTASMTAAMWYSTFVHEWMHTFFMVKVGSHEANSVAGRLAEGVNELLARLMSKDCFVDSYPGETVLAEELLKLDEVGILRWFSGIDRSFAEHFEKKLGSDLTKDLLNIGERLASIYFEAEEKGIDPAKKIDALYHDLEVRLAKVVEGSID